MKDFLTGVFFWVNVTWIKILVALVTSRTIKGRENIPSQGPVILVCNHMNNADPPIVLSIIPRRSKWLVKIEWFRNPVIGFLAKAGGLMPVKRYEADLKALRKAQEVLKSGLILGVFPEGTRSRNQMLSTGEPGAALLALRTKAPILPVAIWGTENMKLPRDVLRRTSGIHIRFGKPFVLRTVSSRIQRSDIEYGTDCLMLAIAKLLPTRYRGSYADQATLEQIEREKVI